MCRVNIGDWPKNAGDEGAEHGVYADRVGDQRHHPGCHQDRRDDRELAEEPVVRPADEPKHEAAADGEAENEKDRRAEEALGERGGVDPAVQCKPEGHGHDDPADRVVDDRSRDDHLADRTAEEADLAHHHRNDLYRRDRQRGPEKQRCDQSLPRIGQHRVRQQLAQENAAEERYGDPGDRHADRSPARAADNRQVGLHTGQQKQQQNTELRDGVAHRLLVRARRKQGMLKLGPEGTQNGGTEQDAGDQLAHDRRLADPLHQLAHQPPADKQRDDLGQENHHGGPVRSLVSGEHQCRNEAEWEGG